MTLLRYLRSLGLRPVAAGNLKGMVDYYRNPETQRAFAEKNDQNRWKVTSFADATKLSMEATVLANATVNTGGKSEAQTFAALLAALPRGGEPTPPT